VLDVPYVRLRVGQAASLVLEPNPSLKIAVGSSTHKGRIENGRWKRSLLIAECSVDDAYEIFTVDDVGNRGSVNIKDESDVNYMMDDLTPLISYSPIPLIRIGL